MRHLFAAALISHLLSPPTSPAFSSDEDVRFEEVLVADIAEPKRVGEVWIGVKPGLRRDGGESQIAVPFHLETGLAPDLGIELILPYLPASDGGTAGLGDLAVTMKYDLLGAPFPDHALAVGIEASFPTGKREESFSRRAYSLGPVVLWSARIARLETHLGVEASFRVTRGPGADADADRDDELAMSAAAHYRVREGVGLIGEVHSERAFGDGRFASSAVAGVWYEPLEILELGIGVELPFGPHRESDWGLVSAVWVRF